MGNQERNKFEKKNSNRGVNDETKKDGLEGWDWRKRGGELRSEEKEDRKKKTLEVETGEEVGGKRKGIRGLRQETRKRGKGTEVESGKSTELRRSL